MHLERHSIEKVGWLRAAVLGGQMTELFRQQALSLVLRPANTSSSSFTLLVLPDWFLKLLCRWQRENMFQSHLRLIPKTLHLPGKKGSWKPIMKVKCRNWLHFIYNDGLDPVLAYIRLQSSSWREMLWMLMPNEELGLTGYKLCTALRAAVFFCSEFSAGAVLPLIVA